MASDPQGRVYLETRLSPRWRLREWRCCGRLWQLVLAPQYPERDGWSPPPCPGCGRAWTGNDGESCASRGGEAWAD